MSTYRISLAAGEQTEVAQEATSWFLRGVQPQVKLKIRENLREIGEFTEGEGHNRKEPFTRLSIRNISALACVLDIWVGDGEFTGHSVGLPPVRGKRIVMTEILDNTVAAVGNFTFTFAGWAILGPDDNRIGILIQNLVRSRSKVSILTYDVTLAVASNWGIELFPGERLKLDLTPTVAYVLYFAAPIPAGSTRVLVAEEFWV